jgi:hypothetical protein
MKKISKNDVRPRLRTSVKAGYSFSEFVSDVKVTLESMGDALGRLIDG